MTRSRPALVLVVLATLLMPPTAVSAASPPGQITADLNGKAIDLASVGDYHCHDFDFPRIHCFGTAGALEEAVEPVLGTLSVTAANYVLIFEHGSYAGAYMYVSQDYSVLAFIGWNDRISSFKAVNSETGLFWTDWFYGGNPYSFCCNANVPALGGWNDTFSSVHRT